jgi:hypothetical protein
MMSSSRTGSNSSLNMSSFISDTDFGAGAKILAKVVEGESDIDEEDEDEPTTYLDKIEDDNYLLEGLGAGGR